MKDIWFRVIAGIVLLAAIVGIGVFAYNAGMTQAALTTLPAPSAEVGAQPYPYAGYGMHYWHPFPFFSFGCFGLLLPLFLLFLAFGAFRRMLWGPRWGWHGMHHMHRMGMMGAEGERGVPPFFEEWHKRAHGESDTEKKV